jgi:hypothetical protein
MSTFWQIELKFKIDRLSCIRVTQVVSVVIMGRTYLLYLVMVRPERFELPTNRFEADYSIQLSYGRVFLLNNSFKRKYCNWQAIDGDGFLHGDS